MYNLLDSQVDHRPQTLSYHTSRRIGGPLCVFYSMADELIVDGSA